MDQDPVNAINSIAWVLYWVLLAGVALVGGSALWAGIRDKIAKSRTRR